MSKPAIVPGSLWSQVNGPANFVMRIDEADEASERLVYSVKRPDGSWSGPHNYPGTFADWRRVTRFVSEGPAKKLSPIPSSAQYPHRCPMLGCGAPAYVGATPAAVECTNGKCRHATKEAKALLAEAQKFQEEKEVAAAAAVNKLAGWYTGITRIGSGALTPTGFNAGTNRP